MSRAFVFPGQGAQTIGMGRALAEAYPAAFTDRNCLKMVLDWSNCA